MRAEMQAEKSKDVTARTDAINSLFAFELYKNVCRSLFEKDKLMFAFSMACTLAQSITFSLDQPRLSFLLGGCLPSDGGPSKPMEWLPDKQWQEIVHVSQQFDQFESLPGRRHERIALVGFVPCCAGGSEFECADRGHTDLD